MMEEILMEVSQDYTATLDGKEYNANDLIRCIIDWPCELKWDDGFSIKQGNYQEWKWFRENILVPNTDVIKKIFAEASKLYQKKLKQEEIFRG